MVRLATDNTDAGNGGQTATGSGSPITVSGLTNGDSYTFTVTATNGVGTGSASAASNPVIPSGLPFAPVDVSAASADGQASVSWVSGGNNGSAISSYTVTAADTTNSANGGQTCTYTVTNPETDACTVSGLTDGDNTPLVYVPTPTDRTTLPCASNVDRASVFGST